MCLPVTHGSPSEEITFQVAPATTSDHNMIESFVARELKVLGQELLPHISITELGENAASVEDSGYRPS